jgi:sialate O-acetylesterase
MYYQLFAKMIEAWRAAFDDPEMPFGIISLCTEGPRQTLDNYLEMMVNEGPYIRQVQYQTYLDYVSAGDKNVGFASSYDMRRAWYHPGLKVPVGERISRWALVTQYGKKIDWKPPVVTEMKTDNGQIILTMDIPVSAQNKSPIEGFAISGKDRRFQPAKVEHLIIKKDINNKPVYDYNTIVLSSPHVADPIHFRYAWGRNPMGNLKPRYNSGAPPMATQRSDNWKIHEVPVKFSDKVDRQSTNLVRQTNQMLDMDRCLKNAQNLLDKNKEKNSYELKTWKAKWEK